MRIYNVRKNASQQVVYKRTLDLNVSFEIQNFYKYHSNKQIQTTKKFHFQIYNSIYIHPNPKPFPRVLGINTEFSGTRNYSALLFYTGDQ